MASEWDGYAEAGLEQPTRKERVVENLPLWGGFAIAVICYFVLLMLLP